MKALLLVTGPSSDFFPPTISLLGKPIVCHVVEQLVALGIKEIHTVLHDLPEKVEELLGEGERWGIRIIHHLVKEPKRPFSTLGTSLLKNSPSSVVVGRGDSLLFTSSDRILLRPRQMFVDKEGEWTGWATLDGTQLQDLDSEWSTQQLSQYLGENTTRHAVSFVASTASIPAILDASRYLLDHPEKVLLPTELSEHRPGVWVSHGVEIDPSARLEGPLYLGRNCHIHKGVFIGPYAVVEEGSIVDSYTEVSDSLLFSNTYVGERLTIEGSVVDQKRLHHVKNKTVLEMCDEQVLSEVTQDKMGAVVTQLVERFVALFILIIFSPLVLYAGLSLASSIRQIVALPSPIDPKQWRVVPQMQWKKRDLPILLSTLLSLFDVVAGDVRLVGLPSRSPEEVLSLSDSWKESYLQSKLGIVTLADAEGIEVENRESFMASEMLYQAKKGCLFDLRILWMCLQRAFRTG